MVHSVFSGVVFTANPNTNNLDELISTHEQTNRQSRARTLADVKKSMQGVAQAL
jgi:hypothetical protein